MTEISFKGKEFVYNHHLSVPFRPLEMHPDKGVGEPSLDGNLIIQGDNLHALKALLPLYAGKVDCIFIDPPYNTGNEGWAYNDNVNAPMIKAWMDDNPIGIEDGLRHDKWCAMMWPRLRLLKELLSEDGAIFISIDSIEYARLKLLMDAIFGEKYYIGEFIWKSRKNKDNRNESGLSNDHEFILIYGSKLDGSIRSGADYDNSDGDPRGPWASANMVGLASKEDRPNLHYDLINEETGVNYGCPERGWRFAKDTMQQLAVEDRILWPLSDDGRPRQKKFLSELDARTNVASVLPSVFFTETGTKELNNVLPENDFSFPKTSSLIEFLLTKFESKDLVVLDSFAGSGTTAHAVLAANKRDCGNRRFILVEMEDYADELTAERVRRVINGYDFTGTQKTELMREKVTWPKLKKADALVKQVEALENLHGHEYDKIKATVKDGELIVTGETKVEKRAEGLGGTFTYCTLGNPIELDAILTGESLPDYQSLGAVLFNMATNHPLDPAALDEDANYLGEIGGQKVWLIYRDELDWLRSPDAALTLSFARKLKADHPDHKHLVFAPARYVSQKMLAEENLSVEFAPLPFALYRVERN